MDGGDKVRSTSFLPSSRTLSRRYFSQLLTTRGDHKDVFILFVLSVRDSASSGMEGMKSNRKKLKRLKAVMKIKPYKKQNCGRQVKMIEQALSYYCKHTSLHGLRYIVDPKLHPIERYLWFILVVVSSLFACRTIRELAFAFQAAPTSITIESMNYRISSLPFPSVTLCPTDRVDWNRVLEFERRMFSNDTDKTTLETFRKILTKLSAMSFGDFDELDFLRDQNRSIHNFSGFNVTQVLREVMPRCDKLLSTCWWRNGSRNCCEIFEVQRTEYGFCYSFNSEMAEPSEVTVPERDRQAESRPRRATGYGEWSGVQVKINLENIAKPPDSETEYSGVVVIINGPYVWPNSGTVIPLGSQVSMSVNCVSGHATQKVLNLDRARSPCKYDETGKYNQETCLSSCKLAYVNKYCDCNPSFLFPTPTSFSQRECTMEDLICLLDYNDLFNDYVIYSTEEENPDSAVVCDCPPECDFYIYDKIQVSTVPVYGMKDIKLDVHFVGQTTFRYKTDIVFTPVHLLVSFGGVIGLFLGGSMLSALELVYYLLVAVFSPRCLRRRTGKSRTQSSTAPIVHSTILPILDYEGPLKPTAKRIPIFANYGLEKSNSERY